APETDHLHPGTAIAIYGVAGVCAGCGCPGRKAAMRRAAREALMSAAAIAVLLVVLVSFDDRVRGELSTRFVNHPTEQIALAGHQARTITTLIAEAAERQSLAHAPLLIFAIASTVLVIFMLRT